MTFNTFIVTWMALALPVDLALATEPGSGILPRGAVGANGQATNRALARRLSEIQRDLQQALRAEALSRRHGPNVPDIIRLTELYREMAAHPKRDSSDLLMRMGLQLKTRLEAIADRIARQKHQSVRQKQPTPSDSVSRNSQTHVLAQQLAPPAGPANQQPFQPAANQNIATTALDYGPELVEIIQQTISPATWDINGGKSAVAYFSPRHALVVGAPEPIHHQIADLLLQLRAAP